MSWVCSHGYCASRRAAAVFMVNLDPPTARRFIYPTNRSLYPRGVTCFRRTHVTSSVRTGRESELLVDGGLRVTLSRIHVRRRIFHTWLFFPHHLYTPFPFRRETTCVTMSAGRSRESYVLEMVNLFWNAVPKLIYLFCIIFFSKAGRRISVNLPSIKGES